jgi:hypothetical protein
MQNVHTVKAEPDKFGMNEKSGIEATGVPREVKKNCSKNRQRKSTRLCGFSFWASVRQRFPFDFLPLVDQIVFEGVTWSSLHNIRFGLFVSQ